MSAFVKNLENWVDRQKKIKEMFERAEKEYTEADRLMLITMSRLAFQQMNRTIEAFDQWLKDPMITSHMPREMLIELWSKLREILYGLIDLDIEHTQKFAEHFKKLIETDNVNPLFQVSSEEKEAGRRLTPTI